MYVRRMLSSRPMGKKYKTKQTKNKRTEQILSMLAFFYRKEIWENVKFRKIFKWASPVGSVLLHLALQPVLHRLAVPSKALLCYHNAFWPVNKKERKIEGRWEERTWENMTIFTRVRYNTVGGGGSLPYIEPCWRCAHICKCPATRKQIIRVTTFV